MSLSKQESVQLPGQAEIEDLVRRTIAEWKTRNRTPVTSSEEVFHSPAAEAIKGEIVRTGRKLWQRQYVDGNGGNISARITDNLVICTPTLLSKGDLQAEDLALVDLDNQRLCGNYPHTSEILLHLEIYKSVPQARAVIHCHPPYATAHAVAGVIPPANLVPEQEVFVGVPALSPYETPGTLAFAKTVHSVAKKHNTILLANHGVVCWSDSVTHAEWLVEIIDTYCKTAMIALQLRKDLPEIPPAKLDEILAMKKKIKMPLPDLRFTDAELSVDEYIGEPDASAKVAETENLVKILTGKITALFEKYT